MHIKAKDVHIFCWRGCPGFCGIRSGRREKRKMGGWGQHSCEVPLSNRSSHRPNLCSSWLQVAVQGCRKRVTLSGLGESAAFFFFFFLKQVVPRTGLRIPTKRVSAEKSRKQNGLSVRKTSPSREQSRVLSLTKTT